MGPWSPAGPNWQDAIRTDLVSAITAAEMQCDDPDKVASRWSEIVEIDRADVDGVPTIPLDNATLRFVPITDGRGEGLGGIDLACSDPDTVRANAERARRAGRRRPRVPRRDALLPAVADRRRVLSAGRGRLRREPVAADSGRRRRTRAGGVGSASIAAVEPVGGSVAGQIGSVPDTGNATSITTPLSAHARSPRSTRSRYGATGSASPVPASCRATATAMPIGRRQLEDRAAGGAGHRVEARRHAAHQRAGQRGEPADDAEAGEHHPGQHRRRVRGVLVDEQRPTTACRGRRRAHPAATSSRWPMRSARRPANGDSTAPIGADGASPNPAASGDQPHTSTKNDGISTSQPNVEPTNSAWAMLPTVKLRSRNRSRSSSGCRVARRAHDERRQQDGGHEQRRRWSAGRPSPTRRPGR